MALPEILANLPVDFRRYIEPFAGSAALLFSLAPTDAIVADLNRELIDTYAAIRSDVGRVHEALRRLPSGESAYYRIRSIPPDDLCPVERAARFLYLNRNCFNGLYRTNRAGQFNVPYGPPKTRVGDFQQRLEEAALVLQGATLRCQDFEETLLSSREGDFVYLDPPYVVDERRIFREYLPGSFSTRDLSRLAAMLQVLDERDATFILSYADSKEGHSAARGWYKKLFRTRRHVAGFATSRRWATELLISNRPLT